MSGLSQIVSFTTNRLDLEASDYLKELRALAEKYNLAFFDCQRVPKKFNARSAATWRRYLYLFPLNVIKDDTGHAIFDVNIPYLNELLNR